jgi:ribose transport system permease protein
MPRIVPKIAWSRLLADYGMVGILLLLCLCCSLGTIRERKPKGRQAARRVAAEIRRAAGPQDGIVILSEDVEFADALESLLREAGFRAVEKITGTTRQMRRALEGLVARQVPIDLIATTRTNRLIVEDVKKESPRLKQARIVFPENYRWPTFLTRSNLLNVAAKNVVIGVIAVGMTMVIITGGIDLSVGSLVALSAVVAASLIAGAGGKGATATTMILCSLAAVAVCAGVGGFTGVMATVFKIPPFVVTLAMMWVASGMAFLISGGESISDVPKSYDWLGSDATLLGIPNTLALMLLIYAIGHVVMSRTTLGRHIYAIGGNRQAARLSGIRVNRVLLVVYGISGTMAGVGGVMLASQFQSGVATYGVMYELHAIAAVVVGGTSLAGGEGRLFGTLIGVFIIAVAQNAMNLLELGSYAQNVVLGLIVLAVVLLDMLKRHGWKRLFRPE